MMKIYSDGGSRGNPGQAAIGFVIYDDNDNILIKKGIPIGVATNNVAEYRALKEAIAEAIELGAKDIAAFADSELIVKQIKGEYKIKTPHLKAYYDEICDLKNKIRSFEITHIKRNLNKEADEMLNKALDNDKVFIMDNRNLKASLSDMSVSEDGFELSEELSEKISKLKKLIKKDYKAVVAFSGGVDSSLVLKVTYEVLGDGCHCVTVRGDHISASELEDSVKIADFIGVKQHFIDADIYSIEGLMLNDELRCYHCKTKVFSAIKDYAASVGAIAVYDGSNVDDLSDYRPGMKALKELDIKSPLLEAGFTKKDIRDYSRYLRLETYDKEAGACLISRLPYHSPIDKEKLRIVEHAEKYLKDLGYRNVRVRLQDDIARIEMNQEDIKRFFADDEYINADRYLKSLGIKHVAMDLGGYRTGSMNK